MKISPRVMEAVDAGVDWLNENLPDWTRYVDPVQLDMAWQESCVLGQYFMARYGEANFDRIVHALFNDDLDRATELGFLSEYFNYPELNEAWLQKFVELGLIDDK